MEELGAWYKHAVLIKLFSEGMSLLFRGIEFCFIAFYTMGVRKETNLPLEVLEMFVGLVTLVLVR